MDDRVAVNGEDGRVPVSDPGDCVILDLTKINKATNVSALHHVARVVPGHTWCTLQGR